MALGKPEAYVENYLVKQVEKAGGLCYKFVSPGHNGVPDRCVMIYGLTIWVELKAPGKANLNSDHAKRQRAVHAKMRKRGQDVRIIDTREGVDELLREIGAM